MIKVGRGHILLALPVFLALLSPAAGRSEELDIINRPVNISGLTGLLFTTSPYTQTPGTVEIGASISSENSTKPDFTITEYPATVTVGLPHNSELSLRSSYFHIKEGLTDTSSGSAIDSSATTTASRRWRTGNLDISYKWNFLPQEESTNRPSCALILGVGVPVDNNKNDPKINADTPNYWGVRLGLSAGTEITWKNHILGMYGDAELRTEKRLHDLYEFLNAGILLPISKYQNLQMFMEYSYIHGRDKGTLDGEMSTGFTYGLRLVSERFNLTIGTQFLHKQLEGYDSSDRMMGMMSMKF